MSMQDDETLQIYLEESIEHLADIEGDLLAIEQGGSDIDEDLVNKVYRAAHSIKGGAGFMGLDKIKDLTHEMENILGKIRSRELIPNPEIINILLMASDALRNLINDVEASNEADISEHVEALKSIAEASLPEETTGPPVEEVEERRPDLGEIFPHAGEMVSNTVEEGKNVYLVEMDLIRDLHMKHKPLPDFITELEQTGTIIDSKPDIRAIGTLQDSELPDRFPLTILFATILHTDDINLLFEIDEKDIYQVTDDLSLRPVGVAEPPVTADHIVEEPEIDEQDILHEPDAAVVDKAVAPEKTAAAPLTKAVKKNNAQASKTSTDTSLRVHVTLLDSLMTLAGELVLSRNQLLQSIASHDNRTQEIAGQKIDLITSELQEAIMLTRMQPIGNIFNKFPRVVRDMAINLGKEVDLRLEGKEVELDKTIIEAIGDPLTHLVRNAVDHGIETPDVRQKAGKNQTGQVVLSAFHEAGQVNIEIFDDGKGLDGIKLAEAALKKGLINEDQAAMMSDKEKVNLIFLPGFSTAEKVTDVSGRGVGMDVVKTNLDRLGGQTDIKSQVGKGSTIRIRLPLTLAIIPSQIISTGGDRYAIPQVNLEELLRIPARDIKERIERVGDADVVRLRGNLLPLIRLADVIGLERLYLDPKEGNLVHDRRKNLSDRRSKRSPINTQKTDVHETGSREGMTDHVSRISDQAGASESQPEAEGTHEARLDSDDRRYHAASALNIAVVSTGAIKYGLVVDELLDSEEIVVKPLGRDIKHCKGYAGATIMGDGKIALILDVGSLARMAGLTSVEGTERASEVATKSVEDIKEKADIMSILLFRSAEEEQFAASLSQVERIEKIKRKDIEEIGGKRVIQYRGASLPLFSIDQVAKVSPLADMETTLVIVFSIADREVGLLATGPVDAIETSLESDATTLRQPGIMGSAIIADRTTLLVDIFDLVKTLNPDWFDQTEAIKTPDGQAATILYAEDSRFFRTQVKSFLEDEGYNVIEAEDGMAAWDLLEEHVAEISLVVTDVEMPNLDGLGLAKKIKGDPRYSHLPVIALTTLAGDEEIARGKQMGVDDYQIKLERENLTESIRRYLGG